MTIVRTLIGLVVLSSLIGCGGRREMGLVSGKITYKGKPLPEGTVKFVPEHGRAAAGGINPDGSYRLFTEKPWDGAVVGKHKVCIAPPYKAITPGYPQFSQKYQSQETSNWEADVKAGDNTFNFDIPE